MKSLTVLAIGAVFALPAQSQSTTSNPSVTLRDLIAGKSVPPSLQVKDLNENFARFHFSGANKKDDSALMRAASGQINPSEFNRDYFTKGDTLKLESGTYLIAYAPEGRANITPSEDDEMGFEGEGPTLPQPLKLRTKDKLLISLLDLRNLGNITDLQPFDAENDMESEADRNQEVVRTLKLLGQHLTGWTEEADESWPAWGNLATPEVRQHFEPYAQSEQMWQHPSTGEAFGLNPALAKRDIWEMLNRSWVYMAYERTAAADGARAVLFADGHVERVNPDRWSRLLKNVIKTGAPPSKSYDVMISPNGIAMPANPSP